MSARAVSDLAAGNVPHCSTSRTEVRIRLVVRHRTTRTASHTQGTATTSPSTQWRATDVWGMPTSRATPTAMATTETAKGPDRNDQWGLMSTRTFSPGRSWSRWIGQTPQPSLAAIDPADRRTEPSAPAAE